MSTTYVASVVASYWVVSISMVYLNKILLSVSDSSIPAPLFVTWFQCVITCIICIVLGNMGEKTRANGGGSFLDEFPKVKYNVTIGMQVLPLSLIFVGMVTFNNICLQYVEVSFCKFCRCIINLLIIYFVGWLYSNFLAFECVAFRQCGEMFVNCIQRDSYLSSIRKVNQFHHLLHPPCGGLWLLHW